MPHTQIQITASRKRIRNVFSSIFLHTFLLILYFRARFVRRILCMLQRKTYCRQGIISRLAKDMASEKECRLPPSIEISTRHSWSKANKRWFSSPVRYVPDWLEQMNKFSIKQSAKDYKRTDAYSPKRPAKSRRFTGSTRHGQ